MEALILLAVVACPIVMGTMMLLMWRGMRATHGPSRDAHEEAAPPKTVTSGQREEAGSQDARVA
jgi:hypothetical protein